MKKRFEIPLAPGDGLSGINLFAVDDFLREMGTTHARRELILKVGASRESCAAYEKAHGLPHGAVELVMLSEDKRFKEMDKLIMSRMPVLFEKNTPPEVLEELYRESFSLGRGLQQLYPDASDFMMRYSLLMQRNRHRFMGDFGFSNEYKLQMVEWCFPSCDGGLNCNTKINVNLGVNINVGAVAFVALALVFVVCVAACVWPAKQFGAEFRMPKLC